MSLAVALIVIGLVIGFSAFIFAALNMSRGMIGEDPQAVFKGHIGAVVLVAFGGLLFVLGLVLACVDALHRVQ